MRAVRYSLIGALLLIVPTVALAQTTPTRFEITPYIGWRHGNDVGDVSGVTVRFDSGVAYGFMVDVGITDNLYAEFVYSYRKTLGSVSVPLEAVPLMNEILLPPGALDFDGRLDYYQGGILYQFDTQYEGLRPYLVASIGATHLSAEGTSNTNLSGTLGGGLKYMFSDNIGVRGEYRLFVTDTDFVDRGDWCDFWGFCYTTLTSQYLYQSQLSAGMIIGF